MIATPTTTVDVLRGTTTNAYGDEIDADTVVPGMTGLPASIIEQRQRPHQPKDSEDRIVRYFKGRMNRGLDVRKGDRLRDATGTVYIVENLYQQANPFWSQDLSFDLSLTT
jgi:hypothetical protein